MGTIKKLFCLLFLITGSLILRSYFYNVHAFSDLASYDGNACESDSDPPIIILHGYPIISVAVDKKYEDPGATAMDNCDGDITESICISGNKVDSNVAGTYTVCYDVKDKSGNSAHQMIRKVYVVEEQTIMLPNEIPLSLVRIPAGTYMMGRHPEEQDSSNTEGPQHEITISQLFYLGKYEITQAQWFSLMGKWTALNPPTKHFGLGDDCPVYRISWQDTQEFLAALNEHITVTQQGYATFRLPTEEEWEYACRADTLTRFYWGDDKDYTEIDNYAWYRKNSKNQEINRRCSHPVGNKLPNAFGLYDIVGNVLEWCQDKDAPYSIEKENAPNENTREHFYVLRGGSWNDEAWLCRSANRFKNHYLSRNCNTGFRIAR